MCKPQMTLLKSISGTDVWVNTSHIIRINGNINPYFMVYFVNAATMAVEPTSNLYNILGVQL